MNINKEMPFIGGTTLNFHRVQDIKFYRNINEEIECTATVLSWVNNVTYMEGSAPSNSAVFPVVTDTSSGIAIFAQATQYLINTDTSPFFGGIAEDTPIPVTSLEAVQAKKWASIKLLRSKKEYGGFVWDGSHFDSDPVSQSRIQGAVILAMQAAAAQIPFSITWTLSDDTTRVLFRSDIIAVGEALAQHVLMLHQVSQSLRAQVQAATTVEEVEAIQWPT